MKTYQDIKPEVKRSILFLAITLGSSLFIGNVIDILKTDWILLVVFGPLLLTVAHYTLQTTPANNQMVKTMELQAIAAVIGWLGLGGFVRYIDPNNPPPIYIEMLIPLTIIIITPFIMWYQHKSTKKSKGGSTMKKNSSSSWDGIIILLNGVGWLFNFETLNAVSGAKLSILSLLGLLFISIFTPVPQQLLIFIPIFCLVVIGGVLGILAYLANLSEP